MLPYMSDKFIHFKNCGNGLYVPTETCYNASFINNATFCSCDLDLDPMTFINELDPYSLEVHSMCRYEHPTSSDVHTYRQTQPKLYTMLLRGRVGSIYIADIYH